MSGDEDMSYADDTEYALRHLIELAVGEEALLEERKPLLANAEQRLKVHEWDFQTSDLNEDFSELYVMAAFARAATAGKEVNELNREVARLQSLIGAHQVAVQSVCGAILQIAKQGISIVHDSLENAPTGRMVGTVALKSVVWQARNQAIHFEEGNFRQPVVQVFQELEVVFGPAFSLQNHPGQSRAKQVVDLLGWSSYQAYLSDVRQLGL